MLRLALAVTCLIVVTLCGCPQATPSPDSADEREPALEFQLELDGKSLDVRLDEPFDIEAGAKRSATLRVLPTRAFVRGPVRFRYPREFAFAYQLDPDLSRWTLHGSHAVLMVNRYGPGLDSALIRAETVKAVTRQYRADQVTTAPVHLTLGAVELSGTRIDTRDADAQIRQDLFTFDASGQVWQILLQDTLDDGHPTPEAERTLATLRESFAIAN